MAKTLPLANYIRHIAWAEPALALSGAYGAQYLGGLYPCEMCWWQRYPLMVAIGLGVLALCFEGGKSRALLGLAGLAIFVSGAIGAYHAGVEYGWWQGLTACTASAVTGSNAQVLSQLWEVPLARCDVAPWSLWGISLAGFNALISVSCGVFIMAVALLRRRVK